MFRPLFYCFWKLYLLPLHREKGGGMQLRRTWGKKNFSKKWIYYFQEKKMKTSIKPWYFSTDKFFLFYRACDITSIYLFKVDKTYLVHPSVKLDISSYLAIKSSMEQIDEWKKELGWKTILFCFFSFYLFMRATHRFNDVFHVIIELIF